MANGYPIVFSEMKAKVGVDDVAYSLGYALDKKAGVGKYFELVLGDLRNPTDRIVVRNTPDKASQIWFRRNGEKGDAVSLIRENLNSFNVPGGNEWTRVANVLAKLANQPMAQERRVATQSLNAPQVFDPTRYDVYRIDPNNIHWTLRKRGFDRSTIAAMGDNVLLIRDNKNTKFDGLNIGFPYTKPGNDELAGYEIRGANGFKSKAAGTDSAHSAWMADFPPETPSLSRNVYFFESSFDAMAFYQLNRTRLELSPFSLVSVGGSFNPELASSIMKKYPAAKAWDCFDNDPAGQMYSAALVKAVDKVDFSIEHTGNDIVIKHGDRQIQCPKEQFDFRRSAAELGMKYSTGHWKSPSNFKDWNDCLMGVPKERSLSISKYQRDVNLANQRQSSLKL